jgi:hypothetical protein
VSILSISWPQVVSVGQAKSLSGVVKNSDIRSFGVQYFGYVGLIVLLFFDFFKDLMVVIDGAGVLVEGRTVKLVEDIVACV